tara:strand:- start:311 stop:838 length:528 start_codon:yes stop_codon:yes gene_type:complete
MTKTIKKNTEVILNKEEQALCRFIAKRRYETARGAGVTNSKKGNQSNEATDLEGVAAELVFAKFYKAYPSGVFDIGARSSNKGEDSDGDIAINQLIIDVKATKYETGRLIAAEWKDHSSIDYYALVVGEFPKYEVRGLMSTGELITEERLKTLPNGSNKVYQATQDELCFPEELR